MGKDAKTKSKSASADAGGAPASSRFVRYLLIGLLAVLAGLAWVSVWTYSPTDAPARTVYPPPPVANVAGVVGAYLAYGLLHWLGDGAYVLMVFATVFAVVMLLGGRIPDWPWRLVGLVLMTVAMSAASHLIRPSSPLEGNILGTVAAEFLVGAFSRIGSWVILVVMFGLSLMLTADNLVLRLPGLGKRVLARGAPALRSVIMPPRPAVDVSGVSRAPRAVAAAPRTQPVARPAPKPEPAPTPPPTAIKPKPAKPVKPAKAPKPAEAGQYRLPPIDLLADPAGGYLESQESVVVEKRGILQQTLDDFGVDAQVVGHMTGPVISLFELALAPGVKVSQISSLAPDVARALAVPGVRVVSPLPGRDTVGIEVPNLDKEIVRLKELMALDPRAAEQRQIPLYLGKDAGGHPIIADLASMPHLLLAGTTGSGKSVCINAIISAILLTRRPEDVRLILIDPKMVEMVAFERIPNLLCPIVHDARRVEDVLEWAASKMDERYELLKEAGVRNIVGYNRLGAAELYRRLGADTDEDKAQIAAHMASWVIIIDELADLIMTASKEIENHIVRIAQKARAVGIHLVVATQRPSVNVVTGLIKSNMPCRISFRVATRQESRIVLDQNGAEVLLGQGDMLFLQPGAGQLTRAQGTYVDEAEIRALVGHVRDLGDPVYNDELVKLQSRGPDASGGERDDLFDKAVEVVLTTQRGSVSLIQRRLQIGYSRASRIVDQMAEAGILGDYKGPQARECLIAMEDWQALKGAIQADQSGASAADGTPMSV